MSHPPLEFLPSPLLDARCVTPHCVAAASRHRLLSKRSQRVKDYKKERERIRERGDGVLLPWEPFTWAPIKMEKKINHHSSVFSISSPR